MYEVREAMEGVMGSQGEVSGFEWLPCLGELVDNLGITFGHKQKQDT